MITDEKKHWDDMSPRARDAFGAEHIFGQSVKWFPCWRDPECGTIQIQGNDPDDLDMSGFGGTTEPCYFPEDQDDDVKDDPVYWEVVPNYSTDASADYLVLGRVVSTWGSGGKEIFFESLGRILVQRHFGKDMKSFDIPSICCIEYLKPGDYIHAAWLALNGEKKEGE